MDRFSAMTLLHDEAIYLHEGVQYQVEKLDWDHKKAYVRKVDVEYYTDANLAVQLKVLEIDKTKEKAVRHCTTETSLSMPCRPFLKNKNDHF